MISSFTGNWWPTDLNNRYFDLNVAKLEVNLIVSWIIRLKISKNSGNIKLSIFLLKSEELTQTTKSWILHGSWNSAGTSARIKDFFVALKMKEFYWWQKAFVPSIKTGKRINWSTSTFSGAAATCKRHSLTRLIQLGKNWGLFSVQLISLLN